MQKATILLVEDEPAMLEGMYDLLQVVDVGYDLHVLTADNGQAALRVAEKEPPDLIVSDIMMPTMNGYELLQTVRRNPEWTHIPFIFLTAKGRYEDIHKGRVSGANLYITKPFNPTELVELIEVQLDRSMQLQLMRHESLGLLKRNLMKILNHELRTPLTYVTAYLDMIKVDTNRGIDGNFPEYLRGIQAGCVRLTQLVRDFIQVLELRTGETEDHINQSAVMLDDLPTLLSELVEQARPLAKELGITLDYDEPAKLPLLRGVPGMLQDAIGRILDNAIKFTSQFRARSGNVHVNTAVIDQEIHISVSDEGMGFPEQATNRLFDLFYQHDRMKFEQQGAGIGLTIAQGIVTLHGGRIEVESVEEEGSTFTIVLPLLDTAAIKQPTVPDKTQATILVVEDNPHLLSGLEELLQIANSHYSFKILTAENGRVALEVLAKHRPDLIISDIMMPEMNGYQLLTEVRNDPNWLQIPFIFLTAKGEEHEIHKGLRSGVEQYITKPYNSDELIDLIISQLDRHFQIQDIISQDFDDLKRSILNLITPDIQRPLHTVSQFSSDLADRLQEVSTDQELIDSLETIQAESLTLTDLIEDLITLAELWTGEAVLGYEMRVCPISDPHLLLRETVQKYALDPHQPIQLAIRPEDHNLPAIQGVSTMIIDSLQRLIHTCMQRQSTPSVVLSLRQHETYLKIIIAANLPLTANEFTQMQTIFSGERTSAVELLSNTNLQIANGYIDLHNGHIAITPAHPATRPDGTAQPYEIVVALPYHRS